jgi:hypothetical protein
MTGTSVAIGRLDRSKLTIWPPYTMRTKKKELRRNSPLIIWARLPVLPVLSNILQLESAVCYVVKRLHLPVDIQENCAPAYCRVKELYFGIRCSLTFPIEDSVEHNNQGKAAEMR